MNFCRCGQLVKGGLSAVVEAREGTTYNDTPGILATRHCKTRDIRDNFGTRLRLDQLILS